MFALNMLVNTERGNAYTEADYRVWMERAGCTEIIRPDPRGDWIVGRP